jgi:hypothetical protein
MVRGAALDPDPNWLHVATLASPEGLTSGPTPVGEVALNFSEAALTLKLKGGKAGSIPLAGHSQISLADAVAASLAEAGHALDLNRKKIVHDEPLLADKGAGGDYLSVLSTFDGALKHFRETLPGKKTDVVIWPHGFDASFIWFATDAATEQAPHMNFGFSPGSGGLPRPYLYTYPWPRPERLTELALPPLTHWHTEGWIGTVTPYDSLREKDDPGAMVESILRGIFDVVSPLVR